jgi:hypothetical protein
MNLEPPPIIVQIVKMVDVRMRVKRQYLTKPITKAVMNVAIAVKVRPIFSLIPSWMRLVSAVIRVVISPAPSLSKKAIFCRNTAARYCSRIFWVLLLLAACIERALENLHMLARVNEANCSTSVVSCVDKYMT